MNRNTTSLARPLAVGILIVVLIGVLVLLLSPHFYLLERINPDEIGIKQRGGRIVEIVGPGLYSDVGLFVKLDKYSTEGVRFSVDDPEVITRDNQRIGVTVFGVAFRPMISLGQEKIINAWTQYRTIYTNDDALQSVISNLTTQAMKVCVGDRPFQESVVGSDRDAMRTCIDGEINKLSAQFGLAIANVTVPNVTLGEEVKTKLDAITQSRLDTEKAEQDRLRAIAQGLAAQAQQEAEIRVEQSKKQEQARQEITLAKLEQEKLVAQKSVIEAQKANDLLGAQKDLEINKAQAAAATEKAKADLAKEYALAELYRTSPNYYTLQMALANAAAIKQTDKLIFTQEGVFPQLVFGNGFSPVVPLTTGQTTTP